MARMYRECEALNGYPLIAKKQRIAAISPIDADQIPNGYLKSVKVTLIPSEQDDVQNSFMIVASTNDDADSPTDYITAGAVPNGGGTIWLNLKRPVKSSAEETTRPDGEVFIHCLNQTGSPLAPFPVQLAVECWGKFVNLELN